MCSQIQQEHPPASTGQDLEQNRMASRRDLMDFGDAMTRKTPSTLNPCRWTSLVMSLPPSVCLGPSNALGNVPATALPAAQFADWCRPAMSSRENQSQKPRLLLQLAEVVNSRSNIQKRVNKKKACSDSDLLQVECRANQHWVLTTKHDLCYFLPTHLFHKVWRSEIASQSRNLPCSWPVFELVSSIICLHWKMKNKGLHFWQSRNFYHLFSYVLQPHQLQSWGDDSHCERHWIDCWLGWNTHTAPGVQHFEAAKFIQSLLVKFWISCHSQESGLNSKIQSDARDASEQK